MLQRVSRTPPLVHTRSQASEQQALMHQLMVRQRCLLRQQRQEQDEWAAAAQALLRQPRCPKRKREAATQAQPVQGAPQGRPRSQQRPRGLPPASGNGEVSQCIAEVQRRAADLDQQRLCHLAVAVAAAMTMRRSQPGGRPQQAQRSVRTASALPGKAPSLLAAGRQLGCAASKPEPVMEQQVGPEAGSVPGATVLSLSSAVCVGAAC